MVGDILGPSREDLALNPNVENQKDGVFGVEKASDALNEVICFGYV